MTEDLTLKDYMERIEYDLRNALDALLIEKYVAATLQITKALRNLEKMVELAGVSGIIKSSIPASAPPKENEDE